MRKTCPRAKLTVLEALSKCPSRVSGFWERFAQDLDFDALGVEWVPEKSQPLKRGNLRLLHGHQVAKMLPKHHAAKVADDWGGPWADGRLWALSPAGRPRQGRTRRELSSDRGRGGPHTGS
jgi:hypothetical protein